MHKRSLVRWVARLTCLLMLLCVLGFAGYLVLVLPLYGLPSSCRVLSGFGFDESFTIERTTPDGARYTVNNSSASFRLDVVPPDRHCTKLFSDYASALRYCRENELPAIPSVHLVHGKCKQLDDDLCATLELAVEKGLPGDERLGKRAALVRLLSHLLKALEEVSEGHRAAIEAAAVHVGTALSLGGQEPQLPPRLAAMVHTTKKEHLDQRTAQPLGFWTRSEELRNLYLQDRYLARGIRLYDRSPVCIALASAVAADPELSEAFRRVREFHAKLTNPPVYVDPDLWPAPPAPCVSFSDFAELIPDGGRMLDLLLPEAVRKIQAGLRKKFDSQAGFALVSYAESKEYDLLYSLYVRGGFTGREPTLDLIIEAIRRGQLPLEPKPNSGWYDYQWYALETLVAPDRADEAPKLKLSAAYKKRLEKAFRTSLAKCRETHIKHLRLLTLGHKDPAPEIDVGPEFSVEPTATVYLRLARAYRFLRNALHATLGEGPLRSLHRAAQDATPAADDIDTELQRMALLCYGLYERLYLEIGRPTRYLTDEMPPDDLAAAKAEATRWLASLESDPELQRDTRIVVPVVCDPGRRRTRYWGTGGLRLERVRYEYVHKPQVEGPVEPVYVPTHYYLPTDIPLEFDWPSDRPLAREEYRRLCDGHETEDSLRTALGAAKPKSSSSSFPWKPLLSAAVVAAAAAAAYKCRRALASMSPRRLFWRLVTTTVALISLWALALFLFEGYRTRIAVKYLARLNPQLGMFVDTWCWQRHSPAHIGALVDLLSDPNPQVRYLAARFLTNSWPSGDDEEEARLLPQLPGLEKRLRAAAADHVPDVAASAMCVLGCFRSSETTDFLLDKLDANQRVDQICTAALWALGKVAHPKALDTLLHFTHDPRRWVRRAAVRAADNYDDDRVWRRFIEMIKSQDEEISSEAYHVRWEILSGSPDHPWAARFNAALSTAAQDPKFSLDHRIRVVHEIRDRALQTQVYMTILQSLDIDVRDPADAARWLRHLDNGPDTATAKLEQVLKKANPETGEAGTTRH